MRTILGKTKHGTRVIYVPGNHDEQMREICGTLFGNLEIHREYVHTTLRDQKLLVMHGDEFDGAVQCSRWLAALGSGLYDVTLGANRLVNALRRRFGYPYWSLAGYLKSRVGNAMKYVHSFEQAAAQAVRRRELDGIVCFYALIHLPRRLVPAALYEMHRVLAQGGALLLAVHGGEGTLHADEMLGLPANLDVTLFSLNELAGLVEDAGFTVVESHERAPYEGEHPTQRLYVSAVRPD